MDILNVTKFVSNFKFTIPNVWRKFYVEIVELRLLWTECLDIRKLCWKMVIMMNKRENRVYQLWGGHYFLERRIGLQR